MIAERNNLICSTTRVLTKLSGTKTDVTLDNSANTMVANDLAMSVASAPATMVITMQANRVSFETKHFNYLRNLSVEEMTENANIYVCVL